MGIRRIAGAVRATVGLVLIVVVAACAVAPEASDNRGSPRTMAQTPSPMPTPVPSMISADAAIKALQTFVRRPVEATADGPETMGIGTIYRLQGPDVTGAVDAYSGRVVSVAVLDKMPGKTRSLTDDEAVGAALRYLNDRHVPVDGMRSTVEWMDHGDFANYRVRWQLFQGEIAMPESTEVELDGATGEVFTFNDFRTAHGPAPEPKVSRDEAKKAAIASSGVSNPGVKTIDLVFTRPMTPAGLDPNAPLVLVWQVAVDTQTPEVDAGSMVWVDALTGEASVIGRH